MPELVQEIYEQTKIWKHFSKIATINERKNLADLISHAIPILSKITETFPTYTVHDGPHQLNILNLYGKLLGTRLNDLDSLESAILILSAFYHDIGMVFDKDEKDNLEDEEYFEEFLEKNPKARLQYYQAREISIELAEWYCRWSHAKRIWKYLNSINTKLDWNGINIRILLAEVCLSHNESTEYIKGENIPSKFWNKSDLKFCSILLRLADILDFDNSRSPESIFHLLKLDSPTTNREKISHDEWQKHLASRGFDFSDWSQNHNYTIYFKAMPNHPDVESDINSFLDIIENELKKCSIILRFCSHKWRSFKIPEKIDRSNIISQGYTSGEFKFSLDQNQILNLFIGENLYENPFVFIRELLQNAIDTSRHRVFHEISLGQSNFKCSPINITSWHDANGYKWVRIDDFGMGMTLNQIEKYFLKVGSSYYNSDEFKIAKLKYKQQREIDFTPVSKFGIGILSCFIIGDLIEVSTKSTISISDETSSIRLTIKGLSNNYSLYTKNDIPNEMPVKNGYESGYRHSPGTSIAIRVKHDYDTKDFDLSKIILQIIYNAPIDIEYEGTLLKHFIYNQNNKAFKLNTKDNTRIKKFLGIRTNLSAEIHFVPIPLTQNVSHPNIKGIIYTLNLRFYCDKISKNKKISRTLIPWKKLMGYTYSFYLRKKRDDNKTRYLELIISSTSSDDDYDRDLRINLETIFYDFPIFNGLINLDLYRENFLFTHNGIILPNTTLSSFGSGRSESIEISFREENSISTFIFGVIELKDELRPNLSVSRESIKSIPWKLFSELSITIFQNLNNTDPLYNFKLGEYSPADSLVLIRNHGMKVLSLLVSPTELNSDLFILRKEFWPSFIKFTTYKRSRTVFEILNSRNNSVPFYARIPFSNTDYGSYHYLERKILEMYTIYSVQLCIDKFEIFQTKSIIPRAFIEKKHPNEKLNLVDTPPLLFCKYQNFDGICPLINEKYECPFNLEHAFARWLINSYQFLSREYYNLLKKIIYFKKYNDINEAFVKLKAILPKEYKPDFSLSEDDFQVIPGLLPEINKYEE